MERWKGGRQIPKNFENKLLCLPHFEGLGLMRNNHSSTKLLPPLSILRLKKLSTWNRVTARTAVDSEATNIRATKHYMCPQGGVITSTSTLDPDCWWPMGQVMRCWPHCAGLCWRPGDQGLERNESEHGACARIPWNGMDFLSGLINPGKTILSCLLPGRVSSS